ncbi:MAG: peptide/nickel transport system substrate-binding protein [Clostridiales bacterium]|nr:peptide/nickel transport system substrate-binding protein [Clostridiales bacterium]
MHIRNANGLLISTSLVYDRLFDCVPDVKAGKTEFIPMLGESFEEDGNKLIIHLRQGIKWSDGTPFTSKDVLSTYYLGFMAGWPMWKYVDTIETPDDYTVIINWRNTGSVMAPMAFANLIQGPYHIYGKWADQLAPLAEKRDAQGNVDQATNDAIAAIREDLYKFKPAVTEIVGNGPYIISNLTASEAILKKNPNSWCASNLKIDQVKAIRDTTTEAFVSNIMSGAYDLDVGGVAPDVLKQLQENYPEMKIVWSPEYSQPSMQFNVSKYPLDNPNVRKAIICAIDKKALLEVAEPGTQMPDTYCSGLTPTIRDSWLSQDILDDMEDYAYDPSKAEALLKGEGWSKGSDGFWRDSKGQLVQLEVAAMNSWAIFFMCGDAIANQLNEFGLKTEYKAMEISAYWDYLDRGQAMMSFDFRPGGLSYAGQPWEFYRSIYADGAVRMGLKAPTASGDPKINVKLSSGETVDPIALIDELFYEVDKDKQTKITEKLAQATNEFVPIMPIGEKTAPIKIHNTKLSYPDDPLLPEWYGGANTRVIARLLKLGELYYK